VTGNISNHAVNGNAMSSTLTGVFGESASTWHQFGLIMVLLYSWSTYGPGAGNVRPEPIDTKNDTRKAIVDGRVQRVPVGAAAGGRWHARPQRDRRRPDRHRLRIDVEGDRG
jgi:hypothetical protein